MESLNVEANRLMTFNSSSWPHKFISPSILAKSGLYFIGPYDRVKCHFCKVVIVDWEENDDAIEEHKKWSPCCAFLKRRETNNILS